MIPRLTAGTVVLALVASGASGIAAAQEETAEQAEPAAATLGSDWAVDLANVTAVYPWQGLETIMVIVAVIIWIGWHVLQIRQENADYNDDIARYGNTEAIRRALDEHPV